jgi:hypothetical protein
VDMAFTQIEASLEQTKGHNLAQMKMTSDVVALPC